MADATKIQWADHTFNPWIGCTKVSPGCARCYAEADMDHRRGRVKWGPKGTRSRTSESYWQKPITWNRNAQRASTRRRVFCASLADVFEDWDGPIVNNLGHKLRHCDGVFRPSGLPGVERWGFATMADLRRDLFALIDATPNLDWLLVTKRPENIRRMWPEYRFASEAQGVLEAALLISSTPLATAQLYRRNVWLLTSVEDQERAAERVPELLGCRDLAPVLGLSCEPLLDRVDLSPFMFSSDGFVSTPKDGPVHRDDGGAAIDWVIIGGESGPHARLCQLDWIYDLKTQCQEAGVPVFAQQLGAKVVDVVESDDGEERWERWKFRDAKAGEPEEWGEHYRVREFPTPNQ